jgi:DNA-directed RNA polymerase subunit omega
VSGTVANPIGITNPPIDELLDRTDSKYSLVIYAAKRARQINAYYSQLGEGLLEYVGPLVETGVQEKPLSIALREINEGLLDHEHVADPAPRSSSRAPGRPGGQRRHRRVQGGRAAAAAHRERHEVRVVPTAAALQFVGAPTWAALSVSR